MCDRNARPARRARAARKQPHTATVQPNLLAWSLECTQVCTQEYGRGRECWRAAVGQRRARLPQSRAPMAGGGGPKSRAGPRVALGVRPAGMYKCLGIGQLARLCIRCRRVCACAFVYKDRSKAMCGRPVARLRRGGTCSACGAGALVARVQWGGARVARVGRGARVAVKVGCRELRWGCWCLLTWRTLKHELAREVATQSRGARQKPPDHEVGNTVRNDRDVDDASPPAHTKGTRDAGAGFEF